MTKKMQNESPDKDSATQTKKSHLKENGHEKSLSGMFVTGLFGAYNMEQQLIKSLPEMAKATCTEELQDAFKLHLEQTQRHAKRLEKIFKSLNLESKDISCKAMEMLIEDGNKIVDEYEEGALRDSAIIICAQTIEHYEIACYGSLYELADVLGYYKIADLLERTLLEEEETDKKLTNIAHKVNDEAFEMTEELQQG